MESLTDPEALSDERVGRLPVLGDQRGVVALLAGILTLSLQADPLADEGRDDHLEALPGGGALRAPHQPVDAQPDDKQTGDQRGHPGILRCPPRRAGHMKSQTPGQKKKKLQLRGARFVRRGTTLTSHAAEEREKKKGEKKRKKRVLPPVFSSRGESEKERKREREREREKKNHFPGVPE